MKQKTWQLYYGSTEEYDRFRPSYPSEVFDLLKRFHEGRDPPRAAADVGCGTGIFSRQLAVAIPTLDRIECLEANSEMASMAQTRSVGFPTITVTNGFAEHIPFKGDSFDIVSAATSANWFNRPLFYTNAARILRDHGSLIVLQNKHKYWENDLLADFASFQERHIPGYRRGFYSDASGGYGKADFYAELELRSDFLPVERRRINWTQTVSAEEFTGYCYSMGHIKKAIERSGVKRIKNEIRDLINTHMDVDNCLTIDWMCEIVMARYNQ